MDNEVHELMDNGKWIMDNEVHELMDNGKCIMDNEVQNLWIMENASLT